MGSCASVSQPHTQDADERKANNKKAESETKEPETKEFLFLRTLFAWTEHSQMPEGRRWRHDLSARAKSQGWWFNDDIRSTWVDFDKEIEDFYGSVTLVSPTGQIWQGHGTRSRRHRQNAFHDCLRNAKVVHTLPCATSTRTPTLGATVETVAVIMPDAAAAAAVAPLIGHQAQADESQEEPAQRAQGKPAVEPQGPPIQVPQVSQSGAAECLLPGATAVMPV